MSGGDPVEFPKPSDEEQLQVAKEGKLNGLQMALVESCLPRGSLLTSDFEDVSASRTYDAGSQPSSSAESQHGTTLPRLCSNLLNPVQDMDQGKTGGLLVPPPPPPLAQMIRQSLQQAEQLREEHSQTDQLIDEVLEQATEINRELIRRYQMGRKRRLMRELETMYTGSMHVLVKAIRAEFDSI